MFVEYENCFSTESKLISWAWTTAADIEHVVYINPLGDDRFMMHQISVSCKHDAMLEETVTVDYGPPGDDPRFEIDLDLSKYIK